MDSAVSHAQLHKDPIIKVVGVGNGGCNMLQHIINRGLEGVEFIAINTDSLSLYKSTAPLRVQIGVKLSNGLGAGCDPNKGRKAAEESREDIKPLLQGASLVIIIAGMGGGTGTGSSPVIADIAKEVGALTIAVVTRPFCFEGKKHWFQAENYGIIELAKHVDTLIKIEQQKVLESLGTNISIIDAFNKINEISLHAVSCITDSPHHPGYINLEFGDLETLMRDHGYATVGHAEGKGEKFVEDAVQRAFASFMIDQVDPKSATGLLVVARVNANFPITKYAQLSNEISSYANEEAQIRTSILIDEQLAEDQIILTIVLTGLPEEDSKALFAQFFMN